MQDWVRRAARIARVKEGVHILRHTFCSHLAMLDVSARKIQQLTGHKDLSTTLRYMHLSPASIEDGIRALDEPRARTEFGELLETGDAGKTKRLQEYELNGGGGGNRTRLHA